MKLEQLWQVLVGLILGAFSAQFLGGFVIQFWHAVQGQTSLMELFHFSYRERVFIALVPAVLAVCLLRRRRLVAFGMLISSGLAWLFTSFS